jgi:hypothetical protein
MAYYLKMASGAFFCSFILFPGMVKLKHFMHPENLYGCEGFGEGQRLTDKD